MRPWLIVSLLLCAVSCRTEQSSAPSSPSQLPSDPRIEEPDEPSATAEPVAELAEATPKRPRPATGGIYRSEIDRATNGYRPAYVLRQLMPTAYKPANRFQGWKIGHVFPDDPELCAPGCDLYPGDIILSVNGSRLERPEQFGDLIVELRTADRLDVRLLRDGKLIESSYPIVPDDA